MLTHQFVSLSNDLEDDYNLLNQCINNWYWRNTRNIKLQINWAIL